MDLLAVGGGAVDLHADALGGLAQLLDKVLPLADPQVVQVLGQAAPPELVAGELALELAQVPPQVQVGDEVRVFVGEAGVQLVGLRGLVGGTLARVLDRQCGGDHDHLVGAAEPVRLQHHPAHPWVDRQVGEPPAELRQLLADVERSELLQQADAVAYLAPIRRVHEREVLDIAEADRGHLEDHGGEAGALDLGLGEARALGEVLLAEQADADAVRRAPAAALALIGGRL